MRCGSKDLCERTTPTNLTPIATCGPFGRGNDESRTRAMTMTKNISQVFEEFLADQKTRISPKTFLKYQSIISLYQSYLESYWPGHDGEYDKITKAGGTFCDTFGPEEATSGYS